MIDRKVVYGHFLTRRNAAVAAGMTAQKLRTLPGVIRIEGRYDAEEAYPAVQFMPEGGSSGVFATSLRCSTDR